MMIIISQHLSTKKTATSNLFQPPNTKFHSKPSNTSTDPTATPKLTTHPQTQPPLYTYFRQVFIQIKPSDTREVHIPPTRKEVPLPEGGFALSYSHIMPTVGFRPPFSVAPSTLKWEHHYSSLTLNFTHLVSLRIPGRLPPPPRQHLLVSVTKGPLHARDQRYFRVPSKVCTHNVADSIDFFGVG